ncbi:adhesin [Spiroplasma endosymbiont of 'Nebria riversi']|uniref:adhesin n=1 Tax=Spiroplasma endosymbiont of 'Nebria riversi' TaxID=2792084 RepID=UPI001C050BF9|nr:adhesin [Spiroplasma endosymbiont of 'Nebria riversi']
MKKLLSLLTITAIATSIPSPLLANAPLNRVKRDVDKTTSQLIRNKRASEQTYELKLKKGKFLIEKMTNVKKTYDFSLKIESIPRKDVSDWTQKFITFQNQADNEYVEISKWMFFNENSNVYNNLINSNFDLKKQTKFDFNKNITLNLLKHNRSKFFMIEIVNIEIERDSADNLEWVKQQSQFSLVDSTKTMIWTRPDLITADGELNIAIANPNIDKVIFDNVLQPQTAKKWTINVKPETEPRDHNLQVTFTLDGKQYTSEIIVSMLAKTEPTPTLVKKQLSGLIKKPDLGNILDKNDDTIFLAVNKTNNNIIDDFSQIEITKKENNEATLTAKKDSKSYQGSVFIKYNAAPATVVDLKIELQPTATNGAVVDNDYLAQLDSSKMTNKVNTFYYASSENVIKIVKPTPSSVISGVVYGCDNKWNKTSQSSAIDPINGIKLDGSQFGTVKGKYLIELKNELNQTSTIYLQIHGEKTIKEYWNTDNGKQFEQWAKDQEQGYDNIRGSSVTQLNKLFELSKTWKQSLKHLDLKLDNFVVDNIKNVTQDEIDNYKTKLLASVKSQVEKYVPDIAENNDYKIFVNNIVVGDWTSGKDVIVQAVEGSTKLLSFGGKTIPTQQKEQPVPPTTMTEPTPDKKYEDSKLWIIGVVVGVLGFGGIAYLLFRKFVFNKYILPKIYARRQQKVVEQWKRDDREEAEELARKQQQEEKQNNKNDGNKGGDK